jgi:hypothetical protein
MSQSQNKVPRLRRRILNHLGKVALSAISVSFLLASSSAASAVDVAEIAGTKGGVKVLKDTFIIARSKPAIAIATTIVCAACVPVAGAVGSPGLCIACGILVTKTFG